MQHLSTSSFILLDLSWFLAILSVSLFSFKKVRPSIIALTFASFLIGYFFAGIDPFLHLWDEQFHALASKNLAKHWLKPTLFETPILDYDYRAWYGNHIWLHKQPLFLWQMALSQSIFGNTLIGIRFPDIVLHSILTLLIFDLGRMIKNDRVGFLAALFFTFLNYPLELLSGRMGLDHNDFSFMFYIGASFWAYFKYKQFLKIKWVVAVGVFAGCAVLVKWLPGLLIFLCWFCVDLINRIKTPNIYLGLKPILISICASILVFLPWQIFFWIKYPAEFTYETLYSGRHFAEAIEGHVGDWTYHFKELSKLYGEGPLVPYILLAALVFFIFDRKVSRENKIFTLTGVAFVYTFFTVAQTKMTAFPVIVLPLVLIILSNFIVEVMEKIRYSLAFKVCYATAGILIAFLFFDLNLVLKVHTVSYLPNESKERQVNIKQMELINFINQSINQSSRKDKTVIFSSELLNIKIMFFTGITAYGFTPSLKNIKFLRGKGYSIVTAGLNYLPNYIKQDSCIIKIER